VAGARNLQKEIHQFFLSVGYREARSGHRLYPQTYCKSRILLRGSLTFVEFRDAFLFGIMCV
jgi:hypothetical protein